MTRASEAEPIHMGVNWPDDVPRAAELSKCLAIALGFSEAHADEIALVVTELAANLVRRASGGLIQVTAADEGGHCGIQVQTTDDGPGIDDTEQATTSGCPTARGLGLGLSAVNRLMDELEIRCATNGGANIVCRRWQRAQSGSDSIAGPHVGLVFGAATRSCRFMPENGDTFIFKQWERSALAGVIDGLGHGPFAQHASQTVRQYIEQHFDQPLDNLFHGASQACRATRGAAMALARFDLAKETITVASVGNVAVRLVSSPQPFNLIARRGIVGLNAPNPIPAAHPWTAATLLIMHSDGLPTNWDWSDFRALETSPPAVIASQLLDKLGKADDDATVIVARSAA